MKVISKYACTGLQQPPSDGTRRTGNALINALTERKAESTFRVH